MAYGRRPGGASSLEKQDEVDSPEAIEKPQGPRQPDVAVGVDHARADAAQEQDKGPIRHPHDAKDGAEGRPPRSPCRTAEGRS